ncbi:MAG TPA: phosphodiester glycosidase family protein, partial [Desulfobacteria bacterium]|nr:phosphodiester glycosidase family protein [Desulfobacteria bacterium]
MIRRNILRTFISWVTILTMLAGFVPAGTAYAFTETSKSSYTEPVSEGVNVTNTVIHTTDGTLDIYVMTVDLTNPYVKVDTLVGNGYTITNTRGVSKMARDAGAVAAINGDFFQMGENAPLGLTVQSGNLVTSPAKRNDMYGFGLTSDNRPVFTVFNFQGTVTSPAGVNFALAGMNKPTYLADKGIRSDENTLIMYTPKWGAKSRGIVS